MKRNPLTYSIIAAIVQLAVIFYYSSTPHLNSTYIGLLSIIALILSFIAVSQLKNKPKAGKNLIALMLGLFVFVLSIFWIYEILRSDIERM